jgi:hypothetical protein
MLDVFQNYKNYSSRTKEQTKESMKFTFSEMSKIFNDVLDRYLPKFAAEVKLNLPNITQEIKLPKLKKVEPQTMEI